MLLIIMFNIALDPLQLYQPSTRLSSILPNLAENAEKTDGWLCLRSCWKYFAGSNVGSHSH